MGGGAEGGERQREQGKMRKTRRITNPQSPIPNPQSPMTNDK